MMLSILKKISKMLLQKYNPLVICITGSVGKTSTKDAIAAVLSTSFTLRKTPKNLNDEYGVPISVIGGFKFKDGFWALLRISMRGLNQLYFSSTFPQVLVLEVGAGRVGEIKEVAEWLKPHIVVITNLPDTPSHLGVFGSKEKIITEKKHLVDALDQNGKLFINLSEKNMAPFLKDFKGKIINYGADTSMELISYDIIYKSSNNIMLPLGIKIDFNIDNTATNKIEFYGFIGTQNIKALVIAKMIGEELGCPAHKILAGLKNYSPEAGRLRIIPSKTHNITMIDDSYNSSPVAVENSLRTFLSIKKSADQRTIAVLGDMFNFGGESVNIHRSIISAELRNVDILITVGNFSKEWQTFSLNEYKLNKHFKNSTNAAKYIETIQKAGDLILFKGGHLTRLEKAVKRLGVCSVENLVRQEGYYQNVKSELYQEDDE